MENLKRYYVYVAILSISIFGTDLTEFVLSFWILDKSGNLSDYSYFRVFEALPEIALAPFIGVVIDRFSKKKLIISGQVIAALGSVYLAFLFLSEELTPWSIVYVTIISSMATAVLYGAFYVLTKQLLKKDQLMKAMSVTTIFYTIIEFVVPALAPILYKMVDMSNVFLFDVITFSLSILFFSLQKFPPNSFKGSERCDFLNDCKFAWKYIKELEGYRVLVCSSFVVAFLFGVMEFLFVPFIIDVYGETVLGVTVALATIGTIVGMLLLGNLGTVKSPLSKSYFLTALMGVAVLLFSYNVTLYSVGGVLILVYFLSSIRDVFDETFELALIPENILGRINGIQAFFIGMAGPLSCLVGGLIIPYAQAIYDWEGSKKVLHLLPSLGEDASQHSQTMLLVLYVFSGLLIVTNMWFRSLRATKGLDLNYNSQLEKLES